MSSDQPRPGSGEPPEDDPFLKKPQEPPAGGSPYGDGGAPPPPPPPGGAPPPPPPSYGGDPYGGAGPGPYADNPYGGQYGATDPLAGMPPLANRGRRLVARIIDGLLVYVSVSVLATLVLGVRYTASNGDFSVNEDAGKQFAVSVVSAVVYFLYEGLMLTTRGQTLGKMALKIRVAVLENGSIPAGNVGWTRAAVYSLPSIVPCCGFIFWVLNVLWCTWDKPYQQCLHDKAAKTVVVSTA